MSERTVNICGHAIRVLEQPNGELLFNMNDICAALGETPEWALNQLRGQDVVYTTTTDKAANET